MCMLGTSEEVQEAEYTSPYDDVEKGWLGNVQNKSFQNQHESWWKGLLGSTFSRRVQQIQGYLICQ